MEISVLGPCLHEIKPIGQIAPEMDVFSLHVCLLSSVDVRQPVCNFRLIVEKMIERDRD